MKIEKTEFCKRGFGTMTAALFRNPAAPSDQNGWDYVEIIYPSESDYQRSCGGLTPQDAKKLIGKRVSEIKGLGFQVLRGKWHSPTISPNGKITRLIC
uniref:Uncharacterized protein n=1 Tax=viral metagenome TaxID=1070528 RepID=A0A6M3IX00_9ZZZZ